MYERYYGLRERPFGLTSNPRYLLLTRAHAEALSTLQYGIRNRVGIIVLVGEAGTGKTTVIRAAMSPRIAAGPFVLLNNPLLARSEFFEHLARGFGLSDAAAGSKTRFLSELTSKLEARLYSGGQTALIVDEAHALPHEILEEIRLLANIETDNEKLLPVVLAGQPELGDRLNGTSLRQLKQRVALRCSLGALGIKETAAYIAGRIGVAGGDAMRLFTGEAVKVVHEFSGGVPRTVNVICDNALLAGFAADQRPVGREIVLEVCRDLDLRPFDPTPAPPPRAEEETVVERGPAEPAGPPRARAVADPPARRFLWWSRGTA
jgi:general secretion pathway protein A